MTTTIPEGYTPEQLRMEADRRELKARARAIYNRRESRNELVDAILALPADAVRGCGATERLRALLNRLKVDDTEDEEKLPTVGEISAAGRGSSSRHVWWDSFLAENPEVLRHDIFGPNRNPVW
jgi:hypothetical protein